MPAASMRRQPGRARVKGPRAAGTCRKDKPRGRGSAAAVCCLCFRTASARGTRETLPPLIPILLLAALRSPSLTPLIAYRVQGRGALRMHRLYRIVLCAVMMFVTAAPSFAQSASSLITGTVVDSAGGAIPGAAVLVKNESGVSFEAVSNGEGLFNVPNVPPGAYTVTVSLSGFKTAVINNVRVLPATPAAVKATLEVGQLSETVTVAASSELINTQTATVSSTLNADQLNRMPTPTRNALNAVTF